jgi:hypothetical protein
VLHLLELGLLKFVDRTSQLIRFQKLAAWMSTYKKNYRRSTIFSAVVSQENGVIQFAPDNSDEAISKVTPKLGMDSKEGSFDKQNFEEQLAEYPHQAPRNTKDASFDSCAPIPPSDLAPSQAHRIIADPDDFLADDAEMSASYVAHAPSIPSHDSPQRTLTRSGLASTPRRKILADAMAADFVDLTAEDVPSAFINASYWTTNQQSPPYEAEPRSSDPPPKGQTWARRERDEAALPARRPGPPRVEHTTLVGPSVFSQSSVVTTQALQYLANSALSSVSSSSSHSR